MEKKDSAIGESKVTLEKIIDSVRLSRDRLISEMIIQSTLIAFLEERHGVFALSAVKIEFLKRDLKELKDSPLDLPHYASLIKQMKESNLSETPENHHLFFHELNRIVQKYVY